MTRELLMATSRKKAGKAEKDVRELFYEYLKELHGEERTGPSLDSVAAASKEVAEELNAPALRFSRGTPEKYLRGSLPSFRTLPGLARAYSVTIADFFRRIGLSDRDICGHAVSESEAKILDAARVAERFMMLAAQVSSDPNDSALALDLLDELSELRRAARGDTPKGRRQRSKGGTARGGGSTSRAVLRLVETQWQPQQP